MRRSLFLLVFAVLFAPITVPAQSSAFRAQGRYYSAKEAYESGRFADAARMCRESRDYLAGRSNLRLQYLMVSALYRSGQFKEAQKEMELFFEIDGHDKDDAAWKEREKLYQEFPQEVDKLTADETREMSKMIDKIDHEVAADTEGKAAARQELDRAVEEFWTTVKLTYGNATDGYWKVLLSRESGLNLKYRREFNQETFEGRARARVVQVTPFNVANISGIHVDDEYVRVDFETPVTTRRERETWDMRGHLTNNTEEQESSISWYFTTAPAARHAADRLRAALAAWRKFE